MDKAKKKQLKKAVTWALLAALVAGLAAMPLLAKAEAEADGPVASILSGTLETGSITTTLRGGGTLTSDDVEDIKLPSGVKITEFLVKNGDTVAEGTPLAAVDPVSVMTAITEVTATMEYLQEEIRDSKDEKVSSTVCATAGGRVKQVFARQGDSVQEVMLKHGALAVLSLDGLMAVKIQKKLDLPTGSSVTVAFGDGTESEGRVESNLDGTIVVTVEDEGYEIGQTVIVTAADGGQVGSGELYVHNGWSATAFSGTIKTVSAKEEAKVHSGATLFTLSDTDFKAQLEYMASLHREYEQLLQDLFKMYNSGTIDAPCKGTVSGVDQDSVHLLAAEEDADYEVVLMNNPTPEEKGWTLMLLSNVTYDQPAPGQTACNPSAGTECPETDLDKHDSTCPKYCHNNGSCDGIDQHHDACIRSCILPEGSNDCGRNPDYHHKPECIKSCKHASIEGQCTKAKTYPHYLDCIQSCTQSNGSKDCPSTKHHLSCIESCTHADTPDACSANLHHYNDCIRSCTGTELCPASKHTDACFFADMTFTAKVAIVEQIGKEALVVRWDASGKSYPVERNGSGWKFSENADFNTQLLVNKGSLSVANPNAYKIGDVIFVITGRKGNENLWSGVAVYTNIPTPGGSQGSIPGLGDLSSLLGGLGGLMGGFGMTGFNAVPPVETNKLFDLEGSILMTVSPESTVSLSITLDEQDISKVSVGQKAAVKVLALPGEVFEAEVVEVANRGINSGGSSKFTVKLRMDKKADMLDGMSATASLDLQTKDNIPVIPVAALAQQGAQSVVFTALDKETGEPANPVPVKLGLSDGIHAEILEGLNPGDRYYYSYYDTLELENGVEDRFTLR